MTEEQWDQKQLAALAARRTPVWLGVLLGLGGVAVFFAGSSRGAVIGTVVMMVGGFLAIERNQRLEPMLRELRRLQAEVARLGGKRDQA